MSQPRDWTLAFARQAQADFRAWELCELHPEVVAAECHRLLFLQMACEKLCKAYLIQTGARPQDIQASHGYTAKHLPIVIREQMVESGQNRIGMQGVLALTRHLAREIELLNPSVRSGGARQDNCEYPWEIGDAVISRLDWTFQPLHLIELRGGSTFIKLLKGAILRLVEESA